MHAKSFDKSGEDVKLRLAHSAPRQPRGRNVLDSDYSFNYRTPKPSSGHTLPLLRLSSCEREKKYDNSNPISQREKIRARRIYLDTNPDLVLAPSNFWKDKFLGDSYTCEETIIEISIEQSLGKHLEGLGNLFSKGRKITFSIEFATRKKKKSATEAQILQRAADASLCTRVYEHYRWNYYKLLPGQLEEIVGHIKGNMEEGDMEEDVDVSVEIPPNILKNCKVHASAHSRCCDTAKMPPGEDLGDVEGDRQVKLEEYYTWGLAQVGSDRWREALQTGNRFILNHFLDLNSILYNIKKFQREGKKS
ncbi:hypothetical protein V8E51_001293 [Hyaloscypha variabilis]